jgi:exosome complex RNA-binding protein Csl4
LKTAIGSLTLTLALTLTATSVVARPVLNLQARVMPPKEFDKPYTGKLVVVRVKDIAQVRAACPTVAVNGNPACMTFKDGICTITILHDSELEKLGIPPALAMRHEIGHCNGWPGDHKGARPWEDWAE